MDLQPGRTLLTVLCLLTGCSAAGPVPARPAAAPPAHAQPGPDYQEWSAASFARAQREHRLLFVSVQAAWCHWCHVMNAETLRDPEVLALLARHFVVIRVDADARPDVAERYAAWGWPANAFLTPDAQPIVNLRGYRAPAQFASLLRELGGKLERGEPLAVAAPEAPAPAVAADQAQLLETLRSRVDAAYDVMRGGYGGPKKYPWAAPVEAAFLRARVYGDRAPLERALAALGRYETLIDRVAGGMYQYSVHDGWEHPHYEKIHTVQAASLQLFADAYRFTGDARWLQDARAIERYLLGPLRAPEGVFYANQDADVGHVGDPEHLPGARYYTLDERGRARYGAPHIDKSVYANYNGQSIAALCALYEATREPRLLEAATRAFAGIEQTHATPLGLYRHAADAGALLHLSDQVEMARALFALYEATGDAVYLGRLGQLVDATVATLRDQKSGGLFAHTPDPDAAGALAVPPISLEDNSRFARLLVQLQQLTGNPLYREVALACLHAVAPAAAFDQPGLSGGMLEHMLTLETLSAPYAVLTVVAEPGDPKGQALYRSALGYYHPTRRVRLDAPSSSKYPYPGHAVLYLCTDDSCSLPVTDPGEIAARAGEFLQ